MRNDVRILQVFGRPNPAVGKPLGVPDVLLNRDLPQAIPAMKETGYQRDMRDKPVRCCPVYQQVRFAPRWREHGFLDGPVELKFSIVIERKKCGESQHHMRSLSQTLPQFPGLRREFVVRHVRVFNVKGSDDGGIVIRRLRHLGYCRQCRQQ